MRARHQNSRVSLWSCIGCSTDRQGYLGGGQLLHSSTLAHRRGAELRYLLRGPWKVRIGRVVCCQHPSSEDSIQREPKDICPIRGETCTSHTAQGSEKVHSMVMSISAGPGILDLNSQWKCSPSIPGCLLPLSLTGLIPSLRTPRVLSMLSQKESVWWGHSLDHNVLSMDHLALPCILSWAFPGDSEVKNQPANAGDARDPDLIPGSGRSPGGGNGNPL